MQGRGHIWWQGVLQGKDGVIPSGRGSSSAGVGPYLVAGLRAGQGWGLGQFGCCCHQAAPQQAAQTPPEEQLPLQLHSQVQTPLWCSLSLQYMKYLVKQTMLAKRKHLLTRKVASHAVWLSVLKHFIYDASFRNKKKKRLHLWRQFHEKPSITLGCPGQLQE